jgi:hypothetical protein
MTERNLIFKGTEASSFLNHATKPIEVSDSFPRGAVSSLIRQEKEYRLCVLARSFMDTTGCPESRIQKPKAFGLVVGGKAHVSTVV